MNIYISNIDIEKVKTQLFVKYYSKQINITHIFSTFGVFEIRNGELWKLSTEDDPIVSINVGKYELLIDTGKWLKKENNYQVPIDHLHIETTQSIYRLNNKSRVKLIIEEENNKITNIFFNTDSIVDFEEIKKDVITFLSMLK